MKALKTLSVLMLIPMLLAVCGTAFARDLTIEEFMAANSTAALLERHSSVALLQEHTDGQSAVWVDREYRYSVVRQDKTVRPGDSEYLISASDLLALTYIQFADGVYPIPMIMLDAGLGESPLYDLAGGIGTDLLYDTPTTAKEAVQSVEEKDGQLVMTTRLTGQDFADAWSGDFGEGCYAELVYTLDPETLELQHDIETAMSADGRPLTEDRFYQRSGDRVQSIQRALYDVPMPEEVGTLKAMLAAYRDAPQEERRTVTFILDAGTAKERSFTSTGAKGFAVGLYSAGYQYDLYTDPAMTQPAPMDDLSSDRTCYVKVYALEDSI